MIKFELWLLYPSCARNDASRVTPLVFVANKLMRISSWKISIWKERLFFIYSKIGSYSKHVGKVPSKNDLYNEYNKYWENGQNLIWEQKRELFSTFWDQFQSFSKVWDPSYSSKCFYTTFIHWINGWVTIDGY